ncbi:unnamed protein product [Paramecium sonneborni]|uniref:Major facilitator superfamily (MFS) profile domain-containing protein n=1 Tax=Paramecium sonneborni TaxID=65129 RepID=A0A8S1PPP8_9CILI|nr:unnamed protein product [Paramecium sonneborni]
MISFDRILETKIGTGFYQFKTLFIIGLVEFCDGIEFTFMSILIAILQKEWDLNQAEVASLGSSFLFGVVLGNLLCAFSADILGRKVTFTIFTGLSSFLVFYTSFSHSYGEMIVLRLCFGLVFGTTCPLGYIFISEVTEAKYRGRFSFGLSLLYIFGKIYFVFLCFFFLDSYTSGNWRGLIRFNGIPITAAFILSLFFIKETIRYHLNKEEYQKAFQEIQIIILENSNGNALLSDEDKKGLQEWSQKQIKEQKEQELHLYGVLSKEYRKETLLFWLVCILTNLQNMSIYLLMPFLFAENKSGFTPMLNMFIIEFLFALILYQIIDNPHYGGRIKIMVFSAAALFVANGLLYVFRNSFLFVGLFIIKISTRGLFLTIGLLTCETYPLYLRSQGCGLVQAIGKIGAIPSPYFLFPLFFIDPYLPFGLMCILSIVILTVTCFFNQDKTLRHLETLKEE